MDHERASGILLPLSSLPSPYGIGDAGPQADLFLDFLSQAGQGYWQVLPLNPTDAIYDNSPYSSNSAFAFNTLLISPERLADNGWIPPDMPEEVSGASSGRAEYARAEAVKQRCMDRAFQEFTATGREKEAFAEFCSFHAYWLDDYAYFVVLKERFHGAGWNTWPGALRERKRQALAEVDRDDADLLRKIKFQQFLCFAQWDRLKDSARRHGVRLFGDMPIYVNYDSADVWAHPELFKLDTDGQARYVAGVPPDYFSETGQRWGMPVYNWEQAARDGFAWWMARIGHNLRLFDVARIDHFRGLVGYWQIPAEETTGINGTWQKAPADAFFTRMQQQFPGLSLVAEDLGIITPDVKKIMKKFGIPGMRVLLFAFSDDWKTHAYNPDNYIASCLAYTGTHDNNTIRGWWERDATDREKQNVEAFLKKPVDPAVLHWDLIERVTASKARLVIFPMQDVLGLGPEARMNTPATCDGNWSWRLTQDRPSEQVTGHLARLTENAGRRAKLRPEAGDAGAGT